MAEHGLSRRQLFTTAATATLGGLSGCLGYLPVDKGTPNEDSGSTIHVKPDGSPFNSGSPDDPLGSIDRATDFADPGDTVYVHPGEYTELVDLNTGGNSDNPFILTGPPEAVLRPPEGKDQATLDINESYTHLTGLTITGLHNSDEPEDPASYHPGKHISIDGDADAPDEFLEGLVVSPHRIGGAGQALINSVQFKDSTIGGFKVIGPAGTQWIFGDSEGHNGEIVYLGTAPDNRVERGFEEYDRTRNIRVHHIDNSEGHLHSELVDCKAGVENVTIEHCIDGGGAKSNDSYYTRSISMDGKDCTIRWNIFKDIHGDGVRIGPQNYLNDIRWVKSEPQSEYDHQLGTGHAVYDNVFVGCVHDAINFLRESEVPGRDTNPTAADQQVICGNLADGYSDVSMQSDCPTSVPTSNGVGHLAGESPWKTAPPTKTEIFNQWGQDLHLKVTVQRETVPAGTTFEISVIVTNTGEVTEEVIIGLRTGEHLLDETRVNVSPNQDQQVTFSENLPPIGELEITRNGQKIGSVYVRDE